jgi:hypothetical protein
MDLKKNSNPKTTSAPAPKTSTELKSMINNIKNYKPNCLLWINNESPEAETLKNKYNIAWNWWWKPTADLYAKIHYMYLPTTSNHIFKICRAPVSEPQLEEFNEAMNSKKVALDIELSKTLNRENNSTLSHPVVETNKVTALAVQGSASRLEILESKLDNLTNELVHSSNVGSRKLDNLTNITQDTNNVLKTMLVNNSRIVLYKQMLDFRVAGLQALAAIIKNEGWILPDDFKSTYSKLFDGYADPVDKVVEQSESDSDSDSDE